MLEVQDLHAWYGASHILHGVSITVRQGEVVALVGRNGAGKTTTIRSVMGLMPRISGGIRFDGADLTVL
jgi:branched-chain amino acid transport system ATP-binding protein